jgi:integrase
MKRTDTERGVVLDDRAARTMLADWWPDYFESVQRRLRPSTVASYDQAWRLRIQPTFGAMEVRRIKPGLIDDWIADLTDRGDSPTKIHQASGVLKRLLDRAVRDDAIASNPMAKRAEPLPRLPKTDRPVLEPAEVYELAEAMKHKDDALLLMVLMFLGLRIGEAFALQRRDINLRNKTVTIKRSVGEDGRGRVVVSETKTGRERTLAMPEEIFRALAAHLKSQVPSSGLIPARESLVFPRADGGYRRYGNFRRDSWNPAVRRVNDRRAANDAERAKRIGRPVRATQQLVCTPHDLRGTCASLLIDAGASVRDVADYLGHADITTTLALYARVRPGRATDIARRMDDLVRQSGTTAQRL